ncbi:S-layer homology domain-containing protein [Bacillus sp. FJAT-52991]|uniref:S-layer homology domain-containing protein n=1 Tax=Bacillus kandeliae TaxID=3129297 RepID=A0ABZ2N6F5_9BACI
MAYQPKSYRKFVATAATATLVATAVTPAFAASNNFTDVSAKYKEAVDYLVANDITQGISETKFGIDEQIKRVDAAVMIAKALKLDTAKYPDSGFTDVPERAQGAVNALKAEGIINGKTDTKFGSADPLTRGEVSLILTNAYDLKGDADLKFTDVSDRYKDAVEALVANGITQGKSETKFGTADPIKRGEFAIFLYKTETLEKVAPTVTDVKATGAKTLEVTGKDLQNLKTENITVSGNTVTAISANADGTKATVSLATNLTPNEETVVKTTINEETKEFKFTYKYEVNAVSVENGTFDDDTKGQKASLLVNNEKADINYLNANGYAVSFKAFDDNGVDKTDEVFANASTGELNTVDVTNGAKKYQVEATVSKAGSIFVSERATITFTNLDSAASAISAHELTTTTAKGEIVQKSNTLVVGETSKITELTIAAGSDKTKVTSGFTVKSSNPAVISVKDNVLTAEGPGTAKITVTYGTLTKDIDLTVSAKKREVAKATPAVSPVKLLTNGKRTVDVNMVDQYGDPVVDTADVTIVTPEGFFKTAPAFDPTVDKGKATLNLDVDTKLGSGTIYFKKDDKFLGNLAFQVTKVDNVSKQVLEIIKEDDKSTDLTLVQGSKNDAAVKLELVNYTSENVRNGVQDLTGYTAKYNDKIVDINGGTNGVATLAGNDLEVTAKKAGSTDIAIYDKENKFVAKVTVTVTDNAPKITKVDWVNPGTVNYKGEQLNYVDVLTVTERDNAADIVKGITLSPSAVGQVRIQDEAGNLAVGALFLDKDGNGIFDGDDVELGSLEMTATSDSNFTIAGDIKAGVTTAAGDKGTLVYKIKDASDDKNIVATTSVTVDVK